MGSLSCSSKRNKGWQVKGIELWGRSITLGCSCLLNSALSLGSLGSGEVCVQSEAALAPQRVTVPVPSWSLHVVPGAGSTWHCCCPHRVTVSPVLASAPWPRREVTSCHQVNLTWHFSPGYLFLLRVIPSWLAAFWDSVPRVKAVLPGYGPTPGQTQISPNLKIFSCCA